ncbi:MAG TPA: tetratricopeptide repeat protein, partial [Sphingorhabdus sp.]|nr:tetratricopeptide repeat protein [Sphingorhabdus sp.]
MFQRGRAQLDAGLDALAIESFRAETRINPDSADAYNGLAVAYGRIGRDDLAQRYFETALAKDPMNAKASANLALLSGGDMVQPPQLAVTEPVDLPAPVAIVDVMAATTELPA